MAKILLVEDEKNMRTLLSSYLQKNGFFVCSFESPISALNELEKNSYDLAILDIGLPELDGLELCEKIRQKNSKIPIIMSSARADLGSKILSFERGADDYLAKTYEPLELIARINALLRRSGVVLVLEANGLRLDLERREARLDGKILELTLAEFEILAFLLNHRGKPFSRENLAQATSSIDDLSSPRSIDTHIRNLRAKLGDDAHNPRFIKSVWGIGYKFSD